MRGRRTRMAAHDSDRCEKALLSFRLCRAGLGRQYDACSRTAARTCARGGKAGRGRTPGSGISGFIARDGINHYEERASDLQAAGYFVVFVDYLGRRHLTDCAGGRNVSHAEVAADILEAAQWIKNQPHVAADKIFAVGWSFGGGGVLAALTVMPLGQPLLARAVTYYPDCRGAMPWSRQAPRL